jgi:hypothetical protein
MRRAPTRHARATTTPRPGSDSTPQTCTVMRPAALARPTGPATRTPLARKSHRPQVASARPAAAGLSKRRTPRWTAVAPPASARVRSPGECSLFTMPILAFTMPIRAFTMRRSWRSRSADPSVHDGAKPAASSLVSGVFQTGVGTFCVSTRIAPGSAPPCPADNGCGSVVGGRPSDGGLRGRRRCGDWSARWFQRCAIRLPRRRRGRRR